MKKYLGVMLVLAFAASVFAADAAEEGVKKEAKKAEGEGAVEKLVICDFTKPSTQFEGGEFVEQHLTGSEKMRCKLSGDGGISRLSKKKSDWSNYNYLTFNVFVDGKSPWSGMILIGDKSSYAKWGQNYVENTISLKPGENKNFHVGIEGLFCTYANRALDMKDMQIFKFFGVKEPMYFGNFVLVKEDE